MTNFDRQYRFSAGKAGSVGFELGGASSVYDVPLHIAFDVQKSDLQEQNTATVTIWNLNHTHRSALDEKDCVVSLSAGYGNRLSLIFSGIVTHASTSMDGADRQTEIEVVDNLVEVRDTYVSVAYNGKVNWKKIMDDVAAQMGVAVSYSYNSEFVDIPNGFSYVGPAKDIMTKGCACSGLSWSIQNGVMQVKKPGDVMSKEVYVLSKDTGLLGIPIRVTEAADKTSDKSKIGWDVEYLLNGAIHIDDFVRLESEEVTGYFRVYSIHITGDNMGGDWMCTARLLEVDG